MGDFHIISGKQSAVVMVTGGLLVSLVAMLIGFLSYVPDIMYGTIAGVCYYLLLQFQYQKGLRISPSRAAMNVNNGFLSRVCVVVAFVLFGVQYLGVDVPAILVGLFIPLRLVVIYQVVLIAKDPDLDQRE